MSIKGQTKEATGFIKEEFNEMEEKNSKDPVTRAKAEIEAQKGRDTRNEGRVEDGKQPMLHKPGTGHPPTKQEDNK